MGSTGLGGNGEFIGFRGIYRARGNRGIYRIQRGSRGSGGCVREGYTGAEGSL